MSPSPIDKFGKPIYSKSFTEVVKNSKILNKKGYSESYKKPNLFYKKIKDGVFFADMRSTDVIPIWEDTRPMFYWNFNEEVPMWKRRRLIKRELVALFQEGCECRLSFYYYDMEELRETSCYIDSSEGIYEWQDGYCLQCNRDIQSDDVFCSEKCHQGYEDTFKNECKICKRKLDWKEEIGHHIDYKEDITIIVCRSCHSKIHLSKDPEYMEYKPVNKRAKQEKKYKLVQCNGCTGKTKILISEYAEDKEYYCSKCKKRNSKNYGIFWENWKRKNG